MDAETEKFYKDEEAKAVSYATMLSKRGVVPGCVAESLASLTKRRFPPTVAGRRAGRLG